MREGDEIEIKSKIKGGNPRIWNAPPVEPGPQFGLGVAEEKFMLAFHGTNRL
jgi:hypothetical protein